MPTGGGLCELVGGNSLHLSLALEVSPDLESVFDSGWFKIKSDSRGSFFLETLEWVDDDVCRKGIPGFRVKEERRYLILSVNEPLVYRCSGVLTRFGQTTLVTVKRLEIGRLLQRTFDSSELGVDKAGAFGSRDEGTTKAGGEA